MNSKVKIFSPKTVTKRYCRGLSAKDLTVQSRTNHQTITLEQL